MNPEEMVASYQQEVRDLAQRAEETKKQLKALTGTVSSPDGAVTVTVNAGGALQNLTFGPRAEEMPRAQLSALIVSTARRAQAKAAGQITGIMAPLIGENSKAMEFIKEQIPTVEEPEGPSDASQPQPQRIAYNEEQRDAFQSGQGQQPPRPPQYQQPPPKPPYPHQPPQPSAPQPTRGPQRPQRRDSYEDDYETGPVTREGDW
ncbi:MAG TPA: YbaB/EbfC family nucleoid-associated protein [Pseudonocardiaceae bacterium]|nr:YbaB/EbfC family nucleoid-associated protein [Pseudonocardiaceae bacterium]